MLRIFTVLRNRRIRESKGHEVQGVRQESSSFDLRSEDSVQQYRPNHPESSRLLRLMCEVMAET
jgi:hypothetical protein